MLPLMVGARMGGGAKGLKASAGVGERMTTDLLPTLDSLTGAESDVPLFVQGRDGDTITALRRHSEISTGP